jgi:competence protein ComEC
MKPTWAITIVTLSFLMMGILKYDEINKLQPYYSSQKTFKLANFQSQKEGLKPSEVELLELWESMLTGRSAPVAKWIKTQYQTLGLNHLFTPSGFHLSAVMLPFMKLLPTKRWQLAILMVLGIGLFLIAGQGALKRMVAIKINLTLFGQKEGFILALVFDVLLGSFTNSPLSFCYSFLFLGIIYSKKNFLFLWFLRDLLRVIVGVLYLLQFC